MVEPGPCKVEAHGVEVEAEGGVILSVDGLSLEPGSLVAVIGPNGAGKTTLLRVLAGVLRPTRGRVLVCGLDPRSRAARRALTYIPSHPEVEGRLTGLDVVLLQRYGVSDAPLTWGREDLEAALKALRALGAEKLAGRRWRWMSGGEKRLALVAGALARGSGLILADEPFSNLDLRNQLLAARLLSSMRGKATVVYTAHEPLHAAIADRVVLLNGGRVVADGRPPEVLAKEVLEGVYNVPMEVVEVGGLKVPIPLLG